MEDQIVMSFYISDFLIISTHTTLRKWWNVQDTLLAGNSSVVWKDALNVDESQDFNPLTILNLRKINNFI